MYLKGTTYWLAVYTYGSVKVLDLKQKFKVNNTFIDFGSIIMQVNNATGTLELSASTYNVYELLLTEMWI